MIKDWMVEKVGVSEGGGEGILTLIQVIIQKTTLNQK